MKKFTTKDFSETQKLGEEFAEETLRRGSGPAALVLALQGELGAGKTTFLQGFARGLGVKEKILSPTFIILKKFKIKSDKRQETSDKRFKNFYHIDCYRLNKPEEILNLGFREIITNSENIVAIEWPEKIENILPENITSIKFEHLEKNKREILIRL